MNACHTNELEGFSSIGLGRSQIQHACVKSSSRNRQKRTHWMGISRKATVSLGGIKFVASFQHLSFGFDGLEIRHLMAGKFPWQ